MKDKAGALYIFTRTPQPGQVKTRLIPALGEKNATGLYRTMLRSTVEKASASSADRLILSCTPSVEHPLLLSLARQFEVELELQCDGDLGKRMCDALERGLAEHDYSLVIGCDCPELSTTDIDRACGYLRSGGEVVLGPATDGGYYLIGLGRALPGLFDDMPWGSDRVLTETRERLEKLGTGWQELACYRDIDDEDDLRAGGFLGKDAAGRKALSDAY